MTNRTTAIILAEINRLNTVVNCMGCQLAVGYLEAIELLQKAREAITTRTEPDYPEPTIVQKIDAFLKEQG